MKRKSISVFCAAALLCTLCTGTPALNVSAGPLNQLGNVQAESQEDDLEKILDNCYEQTLGFPRGGKLDMSSESIQNYVKELDEEAAGYWETMVKSDIVDREQLWPGIKPNIMAAVGANTESADLTTTFKYLFKLARAYATEGTSLYQKQEVADEILKGIDFTLEKKWYGNSDSNGSAYYGNWCDHRIGVPQQLLPTIVILQDQISKERMDTYLAALRKQNAHNWSGYTAANLADIALDAIYIAALENNDELMNDVKNTLGKNMFSYTSGNGWHEDGSYIDHNKYAYTGGYGSVLITAMGKMYPLTAGTEYELRFGDERDQFYDEVVFKSFLPLHYAGRITDVVSGRSITRVTAQDRQSAGDLSILADMLSKEKGAELKEVIKQWLIQDPDIMNRITEPIQLAACQEILSDENIEPKEIPEGFYKYNDMDKAVQQTENYAAMVSMHSNKIANYEYGNSEGMKMWNISDGALFINNSDIYQFKDNFWPTVDTLRLPGVTTLYDTERSPSAGNGTFNPNSWVNSMSMGNIGMSGMQISTLGKGNSRDGLKAKKSYFLFDDEIVALGSDIQALSNTGIPAETVIENRKIKEDLSNQLLFNGAEEDVTDNSPSEIVTDQYLKVSTSSGPGAGYPHSLNRNVSENTKELKTKIRMRFANSGINAGIRYYGKNAEGKTSLVFELVLRPNGITHCWDTYDGEAGKDLFKISNTNDWFTLETTMYPETSTMSYKITDDQGNVLAEDDDWKFMVEVESLSAVAYYMNDKMTNRIDTTSFRMEEDGQVTEDVDFTVTTADELLASDGWQMACTDLDGNIRDGECTHNQFTVVTDQATEKVRKGTSISNVTWAHLTGNTEGSDIGYYFPGTATITALKEQRTGEWNDINTLKNWGHDALPAYTRGYATMVIDHGVLETGGEKADYEYVLLPGKSSNETELYSQNPDVEILENSEALHAVRENSLGVTAINSWTSKGGTAGGISVNTYASVMWKETDTTYELAVSDAAHNGNVPIKLTIENANISDVVSKDDNIQIDSDLGSRILELTVDTTGTAKSQQYTAVFKKVNEETENQISTAVLEYAIELAEGASTEGVVDAVVEKFEAAKADAQALLDAAAAGDASVTQKQIDDSWRKLMDIMSYLSFKQGDKTDLEKVIDFAEEIEGKLDSYIESGKSEFEDALAEAGRVYEDGNAMQDETDQAWKRLLNAMADLRLKAEKGALEELVNKAADMDLSAYTAESARTFSTALAEARGILADESLSENDQSVVDEAVQKLTEAQAALVVKEDAGNTSGSGETGKEQIPGKDNGGQQAAENNGHGNGTSGNTGTAGSSGKTHQAVKTGDTVSAGCLALMALAAVLSGSAVMIRSKRR